MYQHHMYLKNSLARNALKESSNSDVHKDVQNGKAKLDTFPKRERVEKPISTQNRANLGFFFFSHLT